MTHPSTPLLAAAAAIYGPVMFVKGFLAWNRRRLIADTPPSKIRSMAMGLVEVNGAAVPRSHVDAPFSGKSCVYWHVDISCRSKSSWSVLHRNTSSQPFYLRDDTGLALVFPQGAECRLTDPAEEVCNSIALPDCYAEYLREHRTILGPITPSGTLRFREYIVEENRPLFVLGTAAPKARAMEVTDVETFAATGTDDPAAVAVRASRLRSLDGEVHATVRRGENNRTFVISEESQMMMMAELGMKSIAYVVLGPILALLGMAYWLWVWSLVHHR
jgi:E3 Ubiquitin ligase